MKIQRIITGWLRRFRIIETTDAQQALSTLRLKICKICPESDSKKLLEIANGKANYVNTLMCTKCNCPCLQKSLVTGESCPLKKW